MKIEMAIKHMDAVTVETVSEFGNLMVGIAASGATMIKERVVNTGINAEGTPFSPYSTKPMLANCSSKYMSAAVCNQLAGSKEKRKELKWVTISKTNKPARVFVIEGGYKEFRDLHGRQTNHVDFTWTGEMMGNLQANGAQGDGVQVISSDDEHRQGHARIGTLSEEQNTKLAGNTERRGDILMLSDSEISILSDTIEEWLAAKWNE